ncbi:MAG: iron-sulfur cluster assembly accessory protein [Mariprofundaceae bacterium]
MRTEPIIDLALTIAAGKRLQDTLATERKKAVRFSVRQAGCSGYEYVMECADQPQADDLMTVQQGITLYIDAESYKVALTGLTIDFQQDQLSAGFVYLNPNKKGECGCGVSFTIQ